MSTRRAFTLVELLITTSIFVAVSTIAISVFSSTVRFQQQAKYSQENSRQAEIAIAALKDVIEHSVEVTGGPTDINPFVVADSNTPGSSKLITLARVREASGELSLNPNNDQWEIYCIFTETNSTSDQAKRLARFIVQSSFSLANPTDFDCTKAGVVDLFQLASDTFVFGPSFLTSERIDVNWLSIRQSSAANITDQIYDIELTTVYDPSNTGQEARASDSFTVPRQIVTHAVANRYGNGESYHQF